MTSTTSTNTIQSLENLAVAEVIQGMSHKQYCKIIGDYITERLNELNTESKFTGRVRGIIPFSDKALYVIKDKNKKRVAEFFCFSFDTVYDENLSVYNKELKDQFTQILNEFKIRTNRQIPVKDSFKQKELGIRESVIDFVYRRL